MTMTMTMTTLKRIAISTIAHNNSMSSPFSTTSSHNADKSSKILEELEKIQKLNQGLNNDIMSYRSQLKTSTSTEGNFVDDRTSSPEPERDEINKKMQTELESGAILEEGEKWAKLLQLKKDSEDLTTFNDKNESAEKLREIHRRIEYSSAGPVNSKLEQESNSNETTDVTVRPSGWFAPFKDSVVRIWYGNQEIDTVGFLPDCKKKVDFFEKKCGQIEDDRIEVANSLYRYVDKETDTRISQKYEKIFDRLGEIKENKLDALYYSKFDGKPCVGYYKEKLEILEAQLKERERAQHDQENELIKAINIPTLREKMLDGSMQDMFEYRKVQWQELTDLKKESKAFIIKNVEPASEMVMSMYEECGGSDIIDD